MSSKAGALDFRMALIASSCSDASSFAAFHDRASERSESQSARSSSSRAFRLRDSAFMSAGVPMAPSFSRIGVGADTISAWAEFAARVDWPTAASRATVLNLSASTQPLPALGAPDAFPASASRAARSASAGSFLSRPTMRLSRLGLTTSTTS